jgi:tetratricopeptide (TPR) repeat protein
MIKLTYLLPFLSVIVLQPTIANALSTEQIQKIAQSVTLKIETTGNGTKSSGSGVLIQKQGNNYLLATNAHVVCSNRNYLKNCDKRPNYQIVTPDLQSHTVTETAVKVLPNLDLALIQFQSDRNYPVATLGNSDSIAIDEPIYAAGFPATKSRFSFYHGTIVASVRKRLTGDGGGYTVIYDAATNPGMSGGGVFDRQGQIIAIHGQGDRYREGTETNVFHDQIRKDLNPDWGNIYNAIIGQKIGINRGIPINYLLHQGSSFGFGANPQNSQTQTLFNPTTADEWFIIALNKAIYPDMDRLAQDKQAAIQDLSKAIKLKPDYLMAYYLRARLWEQTNVEDRALNDYLTINIIQPTS